MASMVALSCGLNWPDSVSTLLVTWPSAIMRRTWYWPPVLSTMLIAVSIIGAKDVGPVYIIMTH